MFLKPMSIDDSETDYQRLLKSEAQKWGAHLQVEASGRWGAWLDHPLIAENYRRRGLVNGLSWAEWIRLQIGGAASRSLDLGCGAGDKSFAIHSANASSYLEGYDISDARVSHAERIRLASGISGHFQVADVNRLKLPADTYDLVFSNHSFHHFVDLEHVMEQVNRSLSQCGYFVLEEYVGPTQFQWTEEQMSLVRTRLSLIPDRLRVSSSSGAIKQSEGRPAVADVIAESPFESIRSSEIAPLFKRFFDVVEMKPLGGTLQQLLYNGITHHFSIQDEEAMKHIRGIIALENELIDAGTIPSDFMLLIGRRKNNHRRLISTPLQSASASEPVMRSVPSNRQSGTARAKKRTWQIGVCGTFDVANYGDLLFPLIAESELKERLGEVTVVPISYNSQTPPHWPYSVLSVTKLPEMIQELDGLLIGGGFLIRFDKDVAPGYVPQNAEIHHPTGFWLTPALLALQHNVPLLWNAPGMHSNEIPAWAHPLVKLAFEQSQYVSVRDVPSGVVIEQLTGVPVAVVPDTAFRIPRLLDLKGEPSDQFIQLQKTSGLDRPYIVVQATMGLEGFCHFAKVNAIHLKGYRFLALPIGPALGETAAIVDTDGVGMVRLSEWPTPLVIAELIARAEAVVGHSYHLMITALATGVPVFTKQCMTVGKYTALGHFENIFQLPPDGKPNLDWFLSRLGRGTPSAQVSANSQALNEHWDRIAEALQKAERKTSIPMNEFWQRLPSLLENKAQSDGEIERSNLEVMAEPVAHLAKAIEHLSSARTEVQDYLRRLDAALLRPDAAQVDATAHQTRINHAIRQLDEARSSFDARNREGASCIREALIPENTNSVPHGEAAPTKDTTRVQMMNLDRIRKHVLNTVPFQWACIKDLYDPVKSVKLASTYPCDHFKLLSAQGGEKDYEYEARSLIGMGADCISHPADLSEAWKLLALDLLTPEYRSAMSELTGLDLTNAPMEVNVFHFGPGCSLGSHCDLPDKLVTHVLYFNRSWNTSDGGCLNILRSADMADVAAEIPPLVGNSAVIVRSDHSWHAVPRVIKHSPQSRRSVTVTFYQPGSVSSMWPANDPTPLRRYFAPDLTSHKAGF